MRDVLVAGCLASLLACGSSEVDAPVLDPSAEVPSPGENSNETSNENDNVSNDNPGTNSNNTNDSNENNANSNNDNDSKDPTLDSDEDGLPDLWERAAGDLRFLDPALADTDDNGIADGDEDFDQDGLLTREEFAFNRLTASTSGAPHPLRLDLVVELDIMDGKDVDNTLLEIAAEAFAAVPIANPDGTSGVGLHFYRDEMEIPVETFNADRGPRNAFFTEHGPMFADRQEPAIPYDQMIHVVFASERVDEARGGEQVDGATPEEAGVYIYYDTIANTFPACGIDDQPAVTFDIAFPNTLVHEIGHALQLGHETDVGGSVNPFNVMLVAATCTDVQERFLGSGNSEPELGNTEMVRAPRFSDAAVLLMEFDAKVSADTGLGSDNEM